MTLLSKPLRHELRSAIDSRQATFRNGSCRQKDFDAIRAAMGRAKVFLDGYPFATDQRVRDWCIAHREDVARIVPASQRKVLSRLLVDELETA